jgi:HSP20 family protein
VGVAETGWIWAYVRETTAATAPLWQPPADVYSTGESWWITLALPGVTRNCVHFEVREGVLYVRATREAPWRTTSGALHSLEIPYGRFERCFKLPDPGARIVAADLIDGCLHIELATASHTTARPR